MPSTKQLALNLASATAAGAVTLVRPARFPKWARRALSLSNTAGTAGTIFFAVRGDEDLPATHPVQRALSTSDILAATSGGLMLVTSGLGLKADARIERFLVERGVKHPRIVMAVGVVTVLFVVKTVQDAVTKKDETPAVEAAAPKTAVSGKAANPGLPTTESKADGTDDETR